MGDLGAVPLPHRSWHVLAGRLWEVIQEHIYEHFKYLNHQKYHHWIGLRENLQETINFPIKYGGFL